MSYILGELGKEINENIGLVSGKVRKCDLGVIKMLKVVIRKDRKVSTQRGKKAY